MNPSFINGNIIAMMSLMIDDCILIRFYIFQTSAVSLCSRTTHAQSRREGSFISELYL
jgi:hypothetical protein